MLVYKDQLEEVARDRSAGRLGEAEGEAARIEISRRLLAAVDRDELAARKVRPAGAVWRRRVVAVIALLVLPASATALYLKLGSPTLPGQPLASRSDDKDGAPFERMVAQVEQHLAKNPRDARGWEVIAPVYVRMGRFDDAVKAWRNAIAYGGDTAEREAELGETLTGAARGVVSNEAKAAFERAVALDKGAVKARYFLGVAAVQGGRTQEAAVIWNAMLKDAEPDAPWVPFVRRALAQLDGEAAPQAPGPRAEDVAAAQDMPAEQRKAMIATMVERLATRLKTEGGDFNNWLRLVRAYGVLGEKDKARDAAADARRIAKDNPEQVASLSALLQELGIDSGQVQ